MITWIWCGILYSTELFAIRGDIFVQMQYFWTFGCSICSSFGRNLWQKRGWWAGSELYVRMHITEPPCYYYTIIMSTFLASLNTTKSFYPVLPNNFLKIQIVSNIEQMFCIGLLFYTTKNSFKIKNSQLNLSFVDYSKLSDCSKLSCIQTLHRVFVKPVQFKIC